MFDVKTYAVYTAEEAISFLRDNTTSLILLDMFPWMGAISVVFSMIVSFIIIWIISRRIKHISAYSLITE